MRQRCAWLLLSFCLMSLSGCKNDMDEVRLITTRTNTTIEKGTNVEITYSDNGVTSIISKSPTLLRYAVEKPYLEFPDGIELAFYKDGKVESTMTSKYAIAQENSKMMTARNDVVVINEKGEKLNTEELIWDEEKELIYSNAFVKISTKDEIIMGNGMQANQNFTNYTIKNITGTMRVKSGDLP